MLASDYRTTTRGSGPSIGNGRGTRTGLRPCRAGAPRRVFDDPTGGRAGCVAIIHAVILAESAGLVLSPSDLNDYVECAHLTTLALEVARGERARPHVADEEGELLRRKGAAHERAHLERLRAEGRTIVEIGLGEPWDFEAAAHGTAEAMRAG